MLIRKPSPNGGLMIRFSMKFVLAAALFLGAFSAQAECYDCNEDTLHCDFVEHGFMRCAARKDSCHAFGGACTEHEYTDPISLVDQGEWKHPELARWKGTFDAEQKALEAPYAQRVEVLKVRMAKQVATKGSVSSLAQNTDVATLDFALDTQDRNNFYKKYREGVSERLEKECFLPLLKAKRTPSAIYTVTAFEIANVKGTYRVLTAKVAASNVADPSFRRCFEAAYANFEWPSAAPDASLEKFRFVERTAFRFSKKTAKE